MGQNTTLALAGLLWLLLAAASWQAGRWPRRERTQYLFVLGSGAIVSIALVTLFAFPALLRSANAPSAGVIFHGSKIWFLYAVAAPLGTLIARFLNETAETDA